MVGLDRMAAGMDVDVAAGVENHRYTPRTNVLCQKCSTGNWWMQTLCERHERYCGCPVDLNPGENRRPGEDDCWNGRKRAREAPEETQWPEDTAKHTETKQNWINRESKSIEAEEREAGGDAGESQSAERNLECCLRGNQDSPSRLVRELE